METETQESTPTSTNQWQNLKHQYTAPSSHAWQNYAPTRSTLQEYYKNNISLEHLDKPQVSEIICPKTQSNLPLIAFASSSASDNIQIMAISKALTILSVKRTVLALSKTMNPSRKIANLKEKSPLQGLNKSSGIEKWFGQKWLF